MSYIHPAAVEHRRKRWTRPDAYRFAPPGSPEAKPPGYLHPWAAVARAEEAKTAAERAERDEFERELLALRHELAQIRLDYELRRFQQKYSPDQPCVPAGDSDGGQWTDGGGGQSSETARTEFAQVIRICIGGSRAITTDRWGNSSYWIDYDCADGFSFRRYGVGTKIPGFVRDPR